MRAKLAAALEEATELNQQTRLSMLRLINAAVRDRLATERNSDSEGDDSDVVDDAEGVILEMLETMIEQRLESAEAYEESGRLELAQREHEEIAVIREFMPQRMSDSEAQSAVDDVIAAVRAHSIRDISKVMAELKRRYAGRMDFADAGNRVRRALCSLARAEG